MDRGEGSHAWIGACMGWTSYWCQRGNTWTFFISFPRCEAGIEKGKVRQDVSSHTKKITFTTGGYVANWRQNWIHFLIFIFSYFRIALQIYLTIFGEFHELLIRKNKLFIQEKIRLPLDFPATMLYVLSMYNFRSTFTWGKFSWL